MSVRALAYIGFGVRDLSAWSTFATDILGMQIASRGADGTLNLRMDERHHRIAVHPGELDDVAYLGWELHGDEDLDTVARRLREAGFAASAGTADECRERNVAAFITCRDPAGIRVEFCTLPAGDVPWPFESPREIAGFHTGREGVGHVVIAVPDAAVTTAFYRDVLGFRVSDYIEFTPAGLPVTITFLHCNSRHHSIAFMQMPSAKRLSHVMVEVNELDDVGRTFSLCEREGVPIALSLGRHINDEMFSFYMVTPSGFTVEYGFGGRSIDDASWQVRSYDRTSIWGHRRLIPAAPIVPAAATYAQERAIP